MSHVEKYAGVRHHYSRGVHEGNWIEDGFGETLHQLRQQNPAKLDSLTTSGRIYTPPNEGVADLRSLRGAPIRKDTRAGISPDIVFPHGPEDEWTRRRLATTSGTELSSPYQTDALQTAEWLTLAQYPHDTPTTRTIRLGMRQPDVPVDTLTGLTVRGPQTESLVQRKRSDWSAQAAESNHPSLSSTYQSSHRLPPINPAASADGSETSPQQHRYPAHRKDAVKSFDSIHHKSDLRGSYPLRVSPLRGLTSPQPEKDH